MRIFTNPHYDFVRWRWHAMAVSLVVIVAGLGVIMTRGLQKGVDFEGGTVVIARFDQQTPIQDVRAAVSSGMPGGGDAVVQEYGPADHHSVMIRVRRTGEESGGDLSREADAVVNALTQGNVGPFKVEGTEIVGPVVGEQLRRRGILNTSGPARDLRLRRAPSVPVQASPSPCRSALPAACWNRTQFANAPRTTDRAAIRRRSADQEPAASKAQHRWASGRRTPRPA
jgi:hypothetical protein